MMGVGSPPEILHAIASGVDMFDCVMPTRIARNGTIYTSKGRVTIKAAYHEKDFSPLDENCSCYVCRNYTKAYLRHLFKSGEIAALIYNTHHNLAFMKSFMDEVRESISERDLCGNTREVGCRVPGKRGVKKELFLPNFTYKTIQYFNPMRGKCVDNFDIFLYISTMVVKSCTTWEGCCEKNPGKRLQGSLSVNH